MWGEMMKIFYFRLPAKLKAFLCRRKGVQVDEE